MTERAVPFHCPYCGDEDLRPHGATHGEWECRACQRAFAIKYLGMLRPAHEGLTTQQGDPS
jgi:ribosomal protein L37AE/L43A